MKKPSYSPKNVATSPARRKPRDPMTTKAPLAGPKPPSRSRSAKDLNFPSGSPFVNFPGAGKTI